MSTALKLMFAAIGIASVIPSSVSAQTYNPDRYRGYYSNGTGTVPDRLRDPHDDRGGGFGGGNG